ncbi:hypothetical protein HS121_17845 [bacterium]|nr:hypothetical protein [bacterium]
MYLNFFGFHKKPFSLTPDPEFFFPSKSHRQGIAHLRYGIKERMGFVALSGEVEPGKHICCGCCFRSWEMISSVP